jgi:hypothetical protein
MWLWDAVCGLWLLTLANGRAAPLRITHALLMLPLKLLAGTTCPGCLADGLLHQHTHCTPRQVPLPTPGPLAAISPVEHLRNTLSQSA